MLATQLVLGLCTGLASEAGCLWALTGRMSAGGVKNGTDLCPGHEIGACDSLAWVLEARSSADHAFVVVQSRDLEFRDPLAGMND